MTSAFKKHFDPVYTRFLPVSPEAREGVLDQYVYATVDVFGRQLTSGSNGGRGHNSDLATGLVIGQHLKGGVFGGLDPSQPKGASLPIDSRTGKTSGNIDISNDDLLACYFKSIMKATGIPDASLDNRIRSTSAINLIA